jgi:ABC-type multidrug transport system fused ATPase/permease subunit
MKLPPLRSGKRTRTLAALVANGLFQAEAAAAGVVCVQQIFDQVILAKTDGFLTHAWPYVLGFLAATVVIAALRLRERIDAERLGYDYTAAIRSQLLRHLSELSSRALGRRSQGAVMLRFLGDLTAIKQWVSMGVARLVVAGVATLAALVILALLSAALAAIVGLVVIAGGAAAFLIGRPMERAVRESRRLRTHLVASTSERIAAMPVVQVYGQARRERKMMKRRSDRLRTAMLSRAFIAGGLRGVIQACLGVATLAALVLGAVEVEAGRATPGTVVAAMSLVALLVPQLRDLGRVFELYQAAKVSEEKIISLLATGPLVVDHPEATRLRKGPGRLELKKVKVAGCLEGVSVRAEPGDVVALIGPNGSGKSTLLALVARLFDPDSGSVLLDRQKIARVTLSSLRRAVGVVSPDLPLLRNSLFANLRYRKPDADHTEIDRVIALCKLGPLVEKLPGGLNARLAERGRNLSLGERQRVMLARALVGQPRLLLLDEVDNHLDAETAEVLKTVLSGYPGTIIMVTHREQLLETANVVWRLEGGRIVEQKRKQRATLPENVTVLPARQEG